MKTICLLLGMVIFFDLTYASSPITSPEPRSLPGSQPENFQSPTQQYFTAKQVVPTAVRDIAHVPVSKTQKLGKPKQERKPVHWASIASLVAGICFFMPFAFVPAIAFGIIGITKSGPEKTYRLKGLAITGMCLGLGVLLFFVWLLIVFANWNY